MASSVQLFGVTNSILSSEFPDYDAFADGANPTTPSATEVDRWINQAAGDVNGFLLSQGFDPATVAADAVALLICQRAVIERAVVYCAPTMRGAAESRAETAATRYAEFVRQVREEPEFLGDVYSSLGMGGGVRRPSDQKHPENAALVTFSREGNRRSQF